jgi:hypothetical protein
MSGFSINATGSHRWGQTSKTIKPTEQERGCQGISGAMQKRLVRCSE